jgi:hypothetical protein
LIRHERAGSAASRGRALRCKPGGVSNAAQPHAGCGPGRRPLNQLAAPYAGSPGLVEGNTVMKARWTSRFRPRQCVTYREGPALVRVGVAKGGLKSWAWRGQQSRGACCRRRRLRSSNR